jgi:23S rRNA maturation mini-RNase III
MRSGKQYVEFTLIKGTNCTVGVCQSDFDPKVRKLACATDGGWGYSARLGNLHHNTLRPTTRWTGQRVAQEGSVIGMLLNMTTGTLTVYHNGKCLGDMVRSGLKSKSLVWMVQLSDGAEVCIARKEEPQEESRGGGGGDVRAYLKRVGLNGWISYFTAHLPENCESIRLVRATTIADLRHMASKANMRLDAATIRQVLNALKKEPSDSELAARAAEEDDAQQAGSSTTTKAPAAVGSYMKRVGLEAWIGYFERHLPANVKSVKLVRATSAADLRRMAAKATMRIDTATIQKVLSALKKDPTGDATDASVSSTTTKAPAAVSSYMKRVGLEAWIGYFEQHLPANVKSVRLVRATSAADLQRMASKANMRLDAATIEQVLSALNKA